MYSQKPRATVPLKTAIGVNNEGKALEIQGELHTFIYKFKTHGLSSMMSFT